MKDAPDPSVALSRGVVIFHEWLVGAGGAERLAIEEYLVFRKMGIPTRLLTFEFTPRGIFGLDPTDVEVVPRNGTLDGVFQLRRRLLALDPDIVIVASGVIDLTLATLFTDIRFLLHQHEAIYKLLVEYRYRILPFIYGEDAGRIRETAFGYRHPPVPAPQLSKLGRVRLEAMSLLYELGLRRAVAVTCLSERAANEIRRLNDRDAVALCGAIHRDIFAYQPGPGLRSRPGLTDRRIFLSVSRLDVMKRIDVMIRAFALIAQQLPDTLLVIGGTGPEEPNLRNLTADLGLTDRVVFLGFVPNEELWDDIASGDVFLCADWTDFDIAPYEAFALGRRVVWTSEIETDPWLLENGAVFSADPTPEALAEAMTRAIAAPDVKRERLASFLERFTWETYFRNVAELAARCVDPLRERIPREFRPEAG